jgi:hypothetical protein
MQIQDIVKKTGTPLSDIIHTPIENEFERRSSSQTFEMNSTVRGMTIDSSEAKQAMMASLPPQPAQVEDETKAIMNALDEKGMLVNPQYFAQTGQRRGFMYHYTDAKGRATKIVFESGIYATNDPWLVNRLNADIARIGGISAYIANISASTYNDIVLQARSYRSMAAGMAGSNSGNAHKLQAEQEKASLKAQLEAQKLMIADLQNQITGNNTRSAAIKANHSATIGINFARTDEDKANSKIRAEEAAETNKLLGDLMGKRAEVAAGDNASSG